ncbi:MAG: AMP-binding protein, partial [Proteobacteria bacterium]|nr:AMP-binding protein [Pseudomonadota bacterium]
MNDAAMNKAPEAMLISERLRAIAEHDANRELIIDPLFGRLRYGDAAEQVERLAAALRAHDLGHGDVVILQLPNWAPFLIFHIALSAIGAVTVTIPIVYRERELAGVIALTGAKALVVPPAFHGFDYAAMAATLKGNHPDLQHVFLVGAGDESPEVADTISYQALMRESWEGRGGSHTQPALDDVAALGFTSGTTGSLKGAIYDTNIIHATNTGFIDRYGLNEGDRILGCSPIGHAVGFTHALRMTLTIGGSIALLERWNPDQALDLIHRERCTFMACATPFLIDLVYHPALEKNGRMSSVRLFLCGGASIPEQLMRDARIALPHTFTSPLWGMTECGGVTTCPFDAPDEKLFETDGLPCVSMDLKVVDQQGAEVPRGQDGELQARGPMVTMGYYNQPELTAEYFLEDGF